MYIYMYMYMYVHTNIIQGGKNIIRIQKTLISSPRRNIIFQFNICIIILYRLMQIP